MAMDRDRLYELLRAVSSGTCDPADAARELEVLPFAELVDDAETHVHARVDHHRAVRTGFPEVVYCQGKTAAQVAAITHEIIGQDAVVLATRATLEHYSAIRGFAPDAIWHDAAHVVVVDRREDPPSQGHVVVTTGGTADIPVAEEAAVCAEVMGCRVTRIFDVGVAGLHRLLAHTETLRSARAIIAVAGMEGALPSLVAGLVDVPVVAVPTSVGYGANFGGVSALLTMLNSCAGGIGVVNIDNGFGAAVLATRINRPPARLADAPDAPDGLDLPDVAAAPAVPAAPDTTDAPAAPDLPEVAAVSDASRPPDPARR
jgi:pyridinium-3,5-biscarboxylic acid mononucleotide synthase